MQKFEIQNRHGLKIVGEIHFPENPIGLAYTMHGLGGFKEMPDIMVLVNSLLNHNYIVVNFDATNSYGESEGKFEEATLQLHFEDLIDVINWAKTESWYYEPFILAGHSMGAYAVARYAEDFPSEVKAVFPFAVVVSGEKSHKAYQNKSFENFKHWEETGWDEQESLSTPGLIKRLPWSHMLERLNHDLMPNVSKLTMPVLLLVGENDDWCPPDMQKTFFEAIPGKKELHIIKGAKHTFRTPEQLKELENIFCHWLDALK